VLKPGGWAVLGLELSAVPVASNDGPEWPATQESLIAWGQQHHLAEAASRNEESGSDASNGHLYQLFRRER
jgi:hypothetical protein